MFETSNFCSGLFSENKSLEIDFYIAIEIYGKFYMATKNNFETKL